MRALLLLVLGAAIVWFVWRGFGPSNSPSGEAQAAPGAMIPIAGEPPGPLASEAGGGLRSATAPGTESRSGGPDAGIRVAADPAPSAPVVVDPRSADLPRGEPAASGTGASQSGELRAGSTGSAQPAAPVAALEVAAAGELLQDPARLAAWLAARGVELPAGRREFASALVHGLAGRPGELRSALDRARAAGGIGAEEQALADALLAPEAPAPAIASGSALTRAGSMKWQESRALARLEAGRHAEAAALLSGLLLAEIASPWKADASRLQAWSAALRDAQRGHRWSRRGTWPSHEVVVKPGDSLITVRKRAIAERPELVVCTGQIARSNELQGEVIHPGAKLRIPTDPVSLLVDLDAHWAFYLAGGEVVAAWPVGVGKEGSATTVGSYRVGEKTQEPMWFPQGRKPVPYGDPENPLGSRWIAWETERGEASGLGFHGTNEPESIGRDASLGCIRMRTEDVEELYEIVPRGALVRVVP
ncbi:MAG: L,D-transpeptidase family protein [Planctomycetes bacterium]|nr:L,D-transpeptidase family protein [Planctomycetota bacterium]